MKREQPLECSGCSCEERWLLHNVRHRGVYRRFCTSCVLKFHPGSFCPICFVFYEESPPSHERVMCLKCSSISHLACVGPDVAFSRFVCPTCVNPSLLFFNAVASSKSRDGGGDQASGETQRPIDQKSAKVLLVATRIAAISMNKAATTVKVEAERRVKEAVLAKKRAREALDRIASLVAKEKEKEKDKASMVSPASVSVVEQKKKFKTNTNGAVAAHKRMQNHIRADGMGNRGGVSASLDSTTSKLKERWAGFQISNVVAGLPRNGVSVQDKDRQKGEENNGLIPAPPGAAQLQHPQNNHGSEEERSLKEFADSDMVPKLVHSNQDSLVSNRKSGVPVTGSLDATS